MKTIKITPELHNDLRKIQAYVNLKTLGETIRFLQLYYLEQSKRYHFDDK